MGMRTSLFNMHVRSLVTEQLRIGPCIASLQETDSIGPERFLPAFGNDVLVTTFAFLHSCSGDKQTPRRLISRATSLSLRKNTCARRLGLFLASGRLAAAA